MLVIEIRIVVVTLFTLVEINILFGSIENNLLSFYHPFLQFTKCLPVLLKEPVCQLVTEMLF